MTTLPKETDMLTTATILSELRDAAHAIAYAAETESVDPEFEATLFVDDTTTFVCAAILYAKTNFGLSTESKWSADMIAAHRYIRKHGLEAAQKEVR